MSSADDRVKQFTEFRQRMNQRILDEPNPVSYTHLDVYKRQVIFFAACGQHDDGLSLIHI